jgi:NADH:ubiquinone oxidoreductase subunit 4 (subunit M)
VSFNKPIISYFNSNHNGFNGCLRIVVILPCIFGQLKTVYISKFADLSRRELCVNTVLVLSIVLGIWPSLVLDTSHVSIAIFAKLCLSTA